MMNALTLSRRRTLQLLDRALAANQFRFARLAALNWLAAYPGDLAVSLAYARSLVGERRLDSAAAVLQGLRSADPEFLEAVDLLAQVEQASGNGVSAGVGAHLFALTGRSRERRTLAAWGGSLWLARQALHEGKLALADEMLRDVLRQAADEPLAQATHLALLRSSSNCDAHSGREVALSYYRRSPDCLAVMLHLADWSLQAGEEEYAVALLHQAAARDVDAQVACRIWGSDFPYRSLWPERLQLALDLSIPAEVSAALGWNRLPAGGALADGTATQRPGDAAAIFTEIPPEPAEPALDAPGTAGEPAAGESAVPQPSLEAAPGETAAPANVAAGKIAASEVAASEAASALDGLSGVEDTRPTRVLRSIQPPVESAAPAVERPGSTAHCIDIAWAMGPEDASPSAAAVEPGEPQDAPDAESANEPGAGPRPLWAPVESAAAVARARLHALVGADHAEPGGQRRPRRPQPVRKPLEPELRQVNRDLDAAAQRLKLGGLARRDGRFPVYVIFSLRRRLEAHYGAGVAALLESEMEALAQTVDRRRGWNARLFLADEPASLAPLGLEPVRSGDPWELKLALADLDAALGRRGQCIGALLIIGGPEIVPFHRLPNPVDDQDADVASDNPYATRSEDYFLPEWPVGRLPGGAGMDARLLLDSLRRIRGWHAAGDSGPGWLRRLLARLRAWLRGGSPARLSPFGAVVGAEALGGWDESAAPAALIRFASRPKAFGYTAAVWKPVAGKVFKVIGRPGGLHVAPPLGYDGGANPTGRGANLPEVSGRLGYFNLHGVVDAPEWFGQRDPRDPSGAPDFPVALRPQDVLRSRQDDAKRAHRETPVLVFTQACYGLHIIGRLPEHSLALSFLSAGSLAVVGCTGMSYGAVAPPLAASDLLAHTFWRQVRQGQTAGEALRQAKLHLAAEMVARQGALDGEDQKTLISFVLYGDPLAQALSGGRLPRPMRYQDGLPFEAPTICDRAVTDETNEPLPSDLLSTVRHVVTRSLPGMADARLTYTHPRAACSGQEHACPTSQRAHRGQAAEREAKPGPRPERRASRLPPETALYAKGHSHQKQAIPEAYCLVTLSKPIAAADGAHPRIARLTLNEHGKLVKLVVSR